MMTLNEDASTSTQPAAGPLAPQPPAPRHASGEAFFQAIAVAWGHLQREERKAARATCSNGRLQHDRLLIHLWMRLGGDTELYGDPSQSPPRLRALLQAVLDRGARLQALTVYFSDTSFEGQEEAQLLALLQGCPGCPLTRLELAGAVPLSGAAAKAVQACCPQLDSLWIDQEVAPWYVAASTEQEAEYHLGCVQLLTLCGPRLRKLQLWGAQFWQETSFTALKSCTALVSLELNARSGNPFAATVADSPGPPLLSSLLAAVAPLRTLQSLCVFMEHNPGLDTPEALHPHATTVSHLSALTALASLTLLLPRCYEHHGENWLRKIHDGDRHAAWCEVREAHRASLLSALRALPQLQHLHCPTLWLHPAEAAPLTALTSLTLGGLLPPAPGGQSTTEPTGGGVRSGGVGHVHGSLPPGLRTLVIKQGVSPRALALLQPPASLTRLDVSRVCFGTSDVTADGQLLGESVSALGPAVRLLAGLRCGDDQTGPICIRGDGYIAALRPREGSTNGHMEWIRQLQGLDGYRSDIELWNIELSAADLVCLGQALPDATALSLQACFFPTAALLPMRAHMSRLTRLSMDLTSNRSEGCIGLDVVVLLLCRPHAGAVQLEHIVCTCMEVVVDAGAVRGSVLQQLESCFGVTGVNVEVVLLR